MTKLLVNSTADGRETWHLVRVLLPHMGMSNEMVLRGLAHAMVLSPEFFGSEPAEWPDSSVRAQEMVDMEDALRDAFAQDGAQTKRLIKAVFTSVTPTGVATPCEATVGVQIYPMVAETAANFATSIASLGNGSVLVDWNLKGERIQVHVQQGGGAVHVFTKDNGLRSEHTEMVSSLLAEHLKNVIECILEAVLVRTFNSQTKTSSITMVVFDILFLNGIALTDCTLRKRRAELARVVVQHDGLKLSKAFEVTVRALSVGKIQTMLDEALRAIYKAKDEDKATSRSDGLIVKRLDGPDSKYFAGRSHPSWQAFYKPPVIGPEAEKMLFEALSEEEQALIPASEEIHFTVISGFRTRSV